MIQADDRLKHIFDEAVKIARSHGHEYVTLEHLLFVLLVQPDLDELLQSNKEIQLDQLMNDLQEHIENGLNEIKAKEEVYPEQSIYNCYFLRQRRCRLFPTVKFNIFRKEFTRIVLYVKKRIDQKSCCGSYD